MLQFIVDSNTECITPSRMYGWSRILPVDEEADLVAASRLVACAVSKIQSIADSVSSRGEFLAALSANIERRFNRRR